MARNARAEFYFDTRLQMYRKRLKDPATGKWTINVYGKTKAECRERAAQRAAELAEAGSDGSQLVYQYAQTWYKLNTHGLGTKRCEDYQNAINNHICPAIGNKRLDAVTLDDGLDILRHSPQSKSSQQKIVTTLKRIFKAAADNDLIRRSPFTDLKPGGKPAAEKEPLTKEQQAALLAAVKGKDVETLVLLCLYLGLRREEALGLKWDCVYLDAATPYVDVRRALRWEHNKPVLGDKLKSKAAYRKLPIPPLLLAHLRALPHKESDFVCHRANGEAHSASSYRRAWEDITEQEIKPVTYKSNRTGEPVTRELAAGDKVPYRRAVACLDFHLTPHILRHTYITELFTSGADVKTVQYLAGHSSVQITLNIYTHLMANQPADTAAQVFKAFGATN